MRPELLDNDILRRVAKGTRMLYMLRPVESVGDIYA